MEKTSRCYLVLQEFCVSKALGFILEQPLTELPEYYQPWMSLAKNVTQLIQTHQLRQRVCEMPLLSTHVLKGHREHRLAHLALSFITMGYVWQEGERQPAEAIPEQIALPLCSVSHTLGLPPILVYADCVLANWRLRDVHGPMDMSNLDTVFTFPGGDACRGFLLVSLLVEFAASPGLQGVAMVMNCMQSQDVDGVCAGLNTVAEALGKMRKTFQLMHRHVDPAEFYGILRIFFSGWRDNPLLPHGLRYEGVCDKPMQFSGGSAAQSSTIQCFDALLGVTHGSESAGMFLKRMRDYMPPEHRRLISALSCGPSLRDFVLSSSSSRPQLCRAYNTCVSQMTALRTYHLCAVARYITVPGSRCPLRGVCAAQEDKGTGGSNAVTFLKGVRDATGQAIIPEERESLCV